LSGEFEVGVSLINLKMNLHQTARFLILNRENLALPMKLLLQLTGQKIFFLSKKLKTTVSTQVRMNPIRFDRDGQVTRFNYNTWIYRPGRHVKLMAGP